MGRLTALGIRIDFLNFFYDQLDADYAAAMGCTP
jgi:hypothetical protein